MIQTDPGWRPALGRRLLLAIFVPWVGFRSGGGLPLVEMRTISIASSTHLFSFGAAILALYSFRTSTSSPLPAIMVAGSAIYGAIVLVLVRQGRIGPKVVPATSQAAATAYRIMFLIGTAIALSTPLMGFTAAMIARASWPYFAALPCGVLFLSMIAPTQANLSREQEKLRMAGSPIDLTTALLEPPTPNG